jgi:hypothetical protein
MKFTVKLERVQTLKDDNEDELLIQELEKKARLTAIEKAGRTPSLVEVLYHMSEEEMLSIRDLVSDAINK